MNSKDMDTNTDSAIWGCDDASFKKLQICQDIKTFMEQLSEWSSSRECTSTYKLIHYIIFNHPLLRVMVKNTKYNPKLVIERNLDPCIKVEDMYPQIHIEPPVPEHLLPLLTNNDPSCYTLTREPSSTPCPGPIPSNTTREQYLKMDTDPHPPGRQINYSIKNYMKPATHSNASDSKNIVNASHYAAKYDTDPTKAVLIPEPIVPRISIRERCYEPVKKKKDMVTLMFLSHAEMLPNKMEEHITDLSRDITSLSPDTRIALQRHDIKNHDDLQIRTALYLLLKQYKQYEEDNKHHMTDIEYKSSKFLNKTDMERFVTILTGSVSPNDIENQGIQIFYTDDVWNDYTLTDVYHKLRYVLYSVIENLEFIYEYSVFREVNLNYIYRNIISLFKIWDVRNKSNRKVLNEQIRKYPTKLRYLINNTLSENYIITKNGKDTFNPKYNPSLNKLHYHQLYMDNINSNLLKNDPVILRNKKNIYRDLYNYIDNLNILVNTSRQDKYAVSNQVLSIKTFIFTFFKTNPIITKSMRKNHGGSIKGMEQMDDDTEDDSVDTEDDDDDVDTGVDMDKRKHVNTTIYDFIKENVILFQYAVEGVEGIDVFSNQVFDQILFKTILHSKYLEYNKSFLIFQTLLYLTDARYIPGRVPSNINLEIKNPNMYLTSTTRTVDNATYAHTMYAQTLTQLGGLPVIPYRHDIGYAEPFFESNDGSDPNIKFIRQLFHDEIRKNNMNEEFIDQFVDIDRPIQILYSDLKESNKTILENIVNMYNDNLIAPKHGLWTPKGLRLSDILFTIGNCFPDIQLNIIDPGCRRNDKLTEHELIHLQSTRATAIDEALLKILESNTNPNPITGKPLCNEKEGKKIHTKTRPPIKAQSYYGELMSAIQILANTRVPGSTWCGTYPPPHPEQHFPSVPGFKHSEYSKGKEYIRKLEQTAAPTPHELIRQPSLGNPKKGGGGIYKKSRKLNKPIHNIFKKTHTHKHQNRRNRQGSRRKIKN